MILSAIDLSAPLTWAILIGWIMSVVLHEFAHGLVAYWGGDYTIKERGGLTLNPLQYVDPFGSIILPLIFLAIGGVPLPGGVTYVNRDLLRNRYWDAAVSAAGPVMNFILFLLLSLPFHPVVGWITVDASDPDSWPLGYIFLATMAQLQMIAAVINLIPVPPLDGFQIVGAFMKEETRIKLMSPPISTFAFIVLFLVIMRAPGVFQGIFDLTARTYDGLGFDFETVEFFRRAWNEAMGFTRDPL
ncbi:MAG: site-2 protease family protein [Tepidisphaeraceae bacterium]